LDGRRIDRVRLTVDADHNVGEDQDHADGEQAGKSPRGGGT
jgi:hypothetical protein